MDASLKSKRNSRYKYGRRRSRSLGGIISTELCKTIDNSLQPEQRLKLLVEYSLKNAFRIAEKEFDVSVGSNKYNKKVSDCLKKIDSDANEKDLYRTSISGEVSLAEQKLADNLAAYNEEAAKLDEEYEKWKNLIENERAALDVANGEIQTCSYKGTLDCKEYDKVNYTKLADDMSLVVENYNSKFDKISSSYIELNKYVELANKVTAGLNKEAVDTFSKKIENTPRTLIKRFKRGEVDL